MLSRATRNSFPRSFNHKPTTIPPTGGDDTTAGTTVDPFTFAKRYSTTMGGGMLSQTEIFFFGFGLHRSSKLLQEKS
jgi:hypothetical protein